MVVGKTVSIVTAENNVGHKAMVYTKGQPAEPKPMAKNTKLHSKTKWKAAPEDVIYPHGS